jgi:hypothetical protein
MEVSLEPSSLALLVFSQIFIPPYPGLYTSMAKRRPIRREGCEASGPDQCLTNIDPNLCASRHRCSHARGTCIRVCLLQHRLSYGSHFGFT